MSKPIWYVIPTANPDLCSATFKRWKAMGYMTAALVDGTTDSPLHCDKLVRIKHYTGYPDAVNLLCNTVLSQSEQTDWVVTGGDDIMPDPHYSAALIASECTEYFYDLNASRIDKDSDVDFATWGVMQPTGDRWMEDAQGRAASERICGSPWMGREFIKRINGGNGPFWNGYFHFYCDEEMKEVTDKLGILWQRRDLTHQHQHWARPECRRQRPEYLLKAKSDEASAKALFTKRKAENFPGHEPL